MLNAASIGFVHHTEIHASICYGFVGSFLRFILVFDYIFLCGGVLAYVSVASHGLQKRAADPLQLELEAVGSAGCGYWEPNLRPLQEQYML